MSYSTVESDQDQDLYRNNSETDQQHYSLFGSFISNSLKWNCSSIIQPIFHLCCITTINFDVYNFPILNNYFYVKKHFSIDFKIPLKFRMFITLSKSNPKFRDITWNAEENEILQEIFHIVLHFPCYISCYIAKNQLPLWQCTKLAYWKTNISYQNLNNYWLRLFRLIYNRVSQIAAELQFYLETTLLFSVFLK